MKKKFLATALISSFLTVNAMDHDMEIVDNLLQCGSITNQNFQLLHSDIDYEKRCKIEAEYMQKCSEFYANAVKIFREHNPKPEQWTIKKLRDSTYDFLHRNGLDLLFRQLAIAEIEIPTTGQELPFQYFTYEEAMQNYEDQQIKCIRCNDNQYVINVHYNDHAGALSLFHDSKYDNIKIGTFATNYNFAYCFCSYACDTGLSTIHMKNALEAYDTYFTHECGHFNQAYMYSDFKNISTKFEMYPKTRSIVYVVSEMFAWIFEFRHLLERPNISKEYIFDIGMRLPLLFGSSTEKVPYYFSNLALSLANQPEKKLVDIANHAIDAIKTGVVINDGEDIRTEFTCVSDAAQDEYGIDSNGVIRFNSEKNKDAIRNLLTKMGYNSDKVFDTVTH